ncbi:MAG: FAD-dependent tricarballylate dehydrogenase TcuA [Chloroflexi bacterium]|nr:FAD-dependent tricarballylate dehydrogenase TcuA [Chloroflexota bacterium]
MRTLTGYDVVVVGAGNAALCAALSALESGARVLVLEKAPAYFRGGNSYFTAGGFRFPYDGLEDIRAVIPEMADEEAASIEVGSYPQRAMYEDIMRVTEGLSDPDLLQAVVSQAYPTIQWMRAKGLNWVLMYGRQAFEVEGKHRFYGGLITEAVGGGKGLVDGLFKAAEEQGAEVLYDAKTNRLVTDNSGRVTGVVAQTPEGRTQIEAGAVVLACGGFEANPEMRARYLGPDWELAKVRGTRYNTGDGIRMALDIDAQPYGHWSSCHAVAWDLNAPPFGDRNIADLFQKHSFPLGIVVNSHGRRFLDEGADFRNYTYAKYGREILKQPHRAAFQIFDSKVTHLLRDEYHISRVTKGTADSIGGLADALEIDREGLVRTVEEFNGSVEDGPFDPSILDGKGTQGIDPPKSNWAQKLDSPPFTGYGVTCGITFTFGGLRINARAQVMDTGDNPIPGLYAAGELVGGLFYYNYAGGTGLMAGSVFGRIAGAEAAKEIRD